MNPRPLNNGPFTCDKKGNGRCTSIFIWNSASVSKSVLNYSVGYSLNLLISYVGFVISNTISYPSLVFDH